MERSGRRCSECVCEPSTGGKCLCESALRSPGTSGEPRTWEWTGRCKCQAAEDKPSCSCKFIIRCECGEGGNSGGECCTGEKQLYTTTCACGKGGCCDFKIPLCKCCQVIRTEVSESGGALKACRNCSCE